MRSFRTTISAATLLAAPLLILAGCSEKKTSPGQPEPPSIEASSYKVRGKVTHNGESRSLRVRCFLLGHGSGSVR